MIVKSIVTQQANSDSDNSNFIRNIYVTEGRVTDNEIEDVEQTEDNLLQSIASLSLAEFAV